MEDRFTPYKIANAIKADLEKTIKSPILKSFRARLQYKSPKTAHEDEEAMIYLITKLEMYAKGWNTANMKSVGELLAANDFVESEKKQLYTILDLQNDVVNRVIKMYAPQMDKDTLQELRNLEIAFRSIKR